MSEIYTQNHDYERVPYDSLERTLVCGVAFCLPKLVAFYQVADAMSKFSMGETKEATITTAFGLGIMAVDKAFDKFHDSRQQG